MQLKRIFRVLACLVITLTNEAAFARFSDNPISVAVDNLSVDFFFTAFAPQNSTCTKGVEAATSKVAGFGALPQMGFFAEGFNSFSLDFNVTDAISDISEFGVVDLNRFAIMSYDRFGSATTLSEFRSTTNGWRRMAFAIPENSVSIQFEYSFTDATVADIIRIGDAVKIDNVTVSAQPQPSVNIAIEENGCIPEPAEPVQAYLPTIVSLLLEAEPEDPPVDEEPTVEIISGTFSLPTGVVPAGDVVYEVTTQPFESFVFEGQAYSSTDQVTISAQDSSPTYQLFIPPDADDEQYKIMFKCLQGCETLNVSTDGYWRDATYKVVGEVNAGVFGGGQSHTVNIEMEDAKIFAGSINFPAGLVPAGGEFFSVNLISLNQEDSRFWNFYSTIIGVQAGIDTVQFRIGVPLDDPVPTAGWFLFLNCIICDSRFEQRLQYATNILIGNPLTVNGADAQLFPVSLPFNFDNLQLTPLTAPP